MTTYNEKETMQSLGEILKDKKPLKPMEKKHIEKNLPKIFNEDTKDFNSYMASKDNPALRGLKDKQEFILKQSEKKQNSMADFAIKRDSALFASSLKPKQELIEDYKYWRKFFEGEYQNGN